MSDRRGTAASPEESPRCEEAAARSVRVPPIPPRSSPCGRGPAPSGPVSRSVPGCRFRPRYNRALLVPVLADLTSLLTTSRQTGVHLPNLQPSAGQFFASLDPINEASAILGPLNTNPRSSVQHQFQDTFPGTSRPSSTLPWRRALSPGAAPPPPFPPQPRSRRSPPGGTGQALFGKVRAVCFLARLRFWAKAGLRVRGEDELARARPGGPSHLIQK